MEIKTDFIKYLSEGVLVLNDQRTVVTVNLALEKLVEDSASNLVGKTCAEVINCHFPGARQITCHLQCPMLNLSKSLEAEPLTFFTASGLRREVLATFTPLEADYSGYGLLILQDVSISKQQERLQTEFIATASHQLRTPLASIKTSISLLLASVGPEFDTLLRRLLENIDVSSFRLERVVNDLIELTNLLSGRLKLRPGRVEVAQLVQNTINLVQPWLYTRGQTLVVDLPEHTPFIEADPARISQVLGHLISNASKFSAPGSTIKLVVEHGPRANKPGPDQLVFNVIDQGIGISAEERDFIFEKFYQVQVTENSHWEGSGLGLPLAKVLVELSGGNIWFESTLGQGSTFSFSVPVAYQPQPPMEPPMQPPVEPPVALAAFSAGVQELTRG